MIRLNQLAKTFAGRVALEPLTLEIPTGAIYGLLGHNGAGKSTTFGCLLGCVRPTSGEAFIDGISVQRHRSKALRNVGAIFETPAFYDYLSGWENLRIFVSGSARVPEARLREAVHFVGLDARINDPVRVYSHGMRQRLALAQALLPEPTLVLLDEPAEGLDPEGIAEMRELILRLNRERNLTVLLSSHLLGEVEQLCTNVAILNRGRLVFQGAWNDLANASRPKVRFEVDDWTRAGAIFAGLKMEMAGDMAYALPETLDVADAVTALVQGGVRVRAVETQRHTLEELYLEAVKTR